MTTAEFAKAMKAPLWVAEVLKARGIETLDGARDFFKPKANSTHDAADLEGLEDIVDALIAFRGSGETLAIYGDYDVDGLTGAALLYLGLKECGFKKLVVHIPSRFDEGYGVTRSAVDELYAEGIRTILTVDTGISAVEEIAYANSLGITTYITDHHKEGPQLPPAAAIANPNLKKSLYPNKQLSGVGVAYKLLELLVRKLGIKVNPKEYLDLFALGTLADVVEVTGENRYYLCEGLKLLSRSRRPGLRELFQSVGIYGTQLRSQEILFRVTPLINACGRMGTPRDAYELLVTQDQKEAEDLVRSLRKTNEWRRAVESETAEKAIRWVDSHPEFRDHPVLFVVGEEWPDEVAGVVGIIAARLVDRYKKPVAVAFNDRRDGSYCASARGVPGFDWHATLASAKDLLSRWGGHCMAAGFSVPYENVDEFRKRIVEFVSKDPPAPSEISPCHECYPLSFDQVNRDTLVWLQRFEPFGQGHELPTFYAEGVELGGECRVVGNSHLKMKLLQAGHLFDAIAFGCGSLCDCLQREKRAKKIFFQPEINRFRDQENLQLLVKRIDLCESQQKGEESR